MSYPVYVLWFIYSQSILYYLTFQSFDYEPTYKRVVRTNFDISAFIIALKMREMFATKR